MAAMLRSCLMAVLLLSAPCCGQQVTETSFPLGSMLNHALEQSLLTGANARPFHIKVHLYELTNPESPYHAEIEEYWVSPQRWRRSIDSEKFTQKLIVNGDQVSEKNSGDYYPLWLRQFIIGIFDMVPEADEWNKTNAKVTQVRGPNGQRSDACARMKFKIGSEMVKNDAFASVCFDSAALLKFVGSPGYSMEFRGYEKFGAKRVAKHYQNDPEPGTKLVATVTLLEELKSPDASLFTITQPETSGQRLQSLRVDQEAIERAAENQPALVWPAVTSGRTSGVLSMYISVDRNGRVREAYPLNADNPGLQDVARDQLLKWQLKPTLSDGVPVQVEAALTFHFDTALANPMPVLSVAEMSRQTISCKPTSIRQGLLPKGTALRVRVSVDEDGNVVGVSPQGNCPVGCGLLAEPIMSIRQCKFAPYLVNSRPTAYQGDVELTAP